MDLDRWTGGVFRRLEDAFGAFGGTLFEPSVRLGVTGLSRAGKTVFITSLVANLLDRARMPQLRAEAEHRIEAAYLQPQPDHTIPRFAFEDHLAALTAPEPTWPESTRSISTLRLSLRLRPSGLFAGVSGPRVVHLDIVDYPGEWLLDLPLMNQSFADWSEAAIIAARGPARAPHAEAFLALLAQTDAGAPLEEPVARQLAATFTAYLGAARRAGLSSVAPGRFLMPGDLEGSPALTFSPLPRPERRGSGSLWRAFERRFDAYKRVVVEPFFRNHFARLDRQIVLIDALGAIHDGPRAVEDLRAAMAEFSSVSALANNRGSHRSSGGGSTAFSLPRPRRITCTIPSTASLPRSPRPWCAMPGPARCSRAPRPAHSRSRACGRRSSRA